MAEAPSGLADQIEHPDGRVELREGVDLSGSALYNHDLAPTTVAQRTWKTYNFAALWVSMAHCIPTYMLASGLITAGLSWKQALFTILLGNLIVLIPILLNSHPGTRYGIPFPVFARAAYGVFGSNFPSILRAIVACGWFGIQCWIGGKAFHTFMNAMWSGWESALGAHVGGYAPTQWLSFILFWALNIFIIFRGMELVRKLEDWAAPYVLVMTGALVYWAIQRANGLGPILEHNSTFHGRGSFMSVFIPSLTAMIGFWATLSLNMPDFTRFGRSQREQAVGQVVALPTTMTLFAAMGVLITSASEVIYGHAIWDPMDLAARFDSRVMVAVSTFTVVIATLAVNIAANVVSPANDFANAFPKYIDFKRGGLLTGVIGIAMCPWKLLADPSGYIFKWLLGYSGGLGSIAGVLIADYWLLRRKQLVLADLYRPRGSYDYGTPLGTNWVAVGATALGCALAWAGAIFDSLKVFYDYAWFVGAFVSAGAYYLGMKLKPAAATA
ncbi:MAG: NCS1 family nucleobase:cation symporter-1 [Myxococcales bacterium]|nr:NCS1 family nucleobase:cation symporter-1 [Myxococcales bacterium]